jgi:hypothetical protein
MTVRSMKILYAALFCLAILPSFCFAQFTISGRVISQSDTKPVAYVSVFLAGTTIGDKTSTAGTFMLKGIRPGKYDLIISIVGYDAFSKELIVNRDTDLGDITIYPKVTNLKEVIIKPDLNRNRNLDLFKEEFLGASNYALDCELVNPDVLTFNYDDDKEILTGSSVDFLVIDNPDLGYRIKYLVTDFSLDIHDYRNRQVNFRGSALFENMKGTPAQEQRWEKRRYSVYRNSSMHFFRALLADQLPSAGFQVLQLNADINHDRPPDSLIQAKLKIFKKLSRENALLKDSLAYWQNEDALPRRIKTYVPQPQTKYDLMKPTNMQGIYALFSANDNAGLEIFYNEDLHFTQHLDSETTLLNFKKQYAFFDDNGLVLNPSQLIISRAWGRNRVAELLPSDYVPPDEGSNGK